MPQRQLLSIASRRRAGLHSLSDQPAALEMPHLRAPILCLACGGSFSAVYPLPQVRKFRSRTHFSRTRGVRNFIQLEALAAFSGLPLRSLSSTVFQCFALPPHRSFHVFPGSPQGVTGLKEVKSRFALIPIRTDEETFRFGQARASADFPPANGRRCPFKFMKTSCL